MSYDKGGVNETDGIVARWYDYTQHPPKVRTAVVRFTDLLAVDGPFLWKGILYVTNTSFSVYRYLDHQNRWVPALIFLQKRAFKVSTETQELIPERYKVPLEALTEQQQCAFIELKLRVN